MKKSGKVNAELQKALAEEIKEIRSKDKDGNFKHTLLDRMRVYDRALKLESVRLNSGDPDEWGSKLSKGDPE